MEKIYFGSEVVMLPVAPIVALKPKFPQSIVKFSWLQTDLNCIFLVLIGGHINGSTH